MSEPLHKESPLARKLGREAAQTENVLKNSFPHETYSKGAVRRGDRFAVIDVGVPLDPPFRVPPRPFRAA